MIGILLGAPQIETLNDLGRMGHSRFSQLFDGNRCNKISDQRRIHRIRTGRQ